MVISSAGQFVWLSGSGLEAKSDRSETGGNRRSPLCDFTASVVLAEAMSADGLAWNNVPADPNAKPTPPKACVVGFVFCSLLAVACASEPLEKPSGASGGSATTGGVGAASGEESGGSSGAGESSGGAAGGTAIKHPGELLLDAIHISSDAQAEHFQRATVPLDLGSETVARATLFVELESPCFPFDKWTRESIPAGHKWPEKCDAFDRGFELSLDEPEPESGGPPALELGRAITPFGGPLSLEFDVTDLVNGASGAHSLSVKIGTWPDPAGLVSGAKGEWIVSAWLHRELGTPPRRVLAVIPLSYGSESLASAAPIAFEVPEGASAGRIDYRVTGHGGAMAGANCIGPAEEFCRRTHTLFVDQQAVDELVPWRSNCASLCTVEHYESALLSGLDYCAENPCGAIASVRASRANWCPGSLVSTYTLDTPALATPGPHEFSWAIDQVAEGGSWLLSATYYAFE
jgi:hypothetical protein